MQKNTIRKYLVFFEDTAERLINQHDLGKTELETLRLEFDRFMREIQSQSNIDPSFLQKLSDIKLNPNKNARRSRIDSYLRVHSWLDFGGILSGLVGEQVKAKDVRDTISEFRDRMSQLLFGFNTYDISDD